MPSPSLTWAAQRTHSFEVAALASLPYSQTPACPSLPPLPPHPCSAAGGVLILSINSICDTTKMSLPVIPALNNASDQS